MNASTVKHVQNFPLSPQWLLQSVNLLNEKWVPFNLNLLREEANWLSEEWNACLITPSTLFSSDWFDDFAIGFLG